MHHIPNAYKYQIRTFAAEVEAMLVGVLPGHDVQESGWPEEIPPHFRGNLMLIVTDFKPLSLWVCDVAEEEAQQALGRASPCCRSRWGPHYCAWKLCRIAQDPGWFLEQSCSWEKFHANPDTEEVDAAVLQCVEVAHQDHRVNSAQMKDAMKDSGLNAKETVRSSWVRPYNSWTSLLDGSRRGRQLKATSVDDFLAAVPGCPYAQVTLPWSVFMASGSILPMLNTDQHPVCFQGVGPPERHP